MSKHTPGPWEAQISDVNPPYITSRRTREEIGHDCVASLNPQLGVDTARANARLIAAAPELLECARVALGLFETYTMQDMTWEQLESELDPEVFAEVRENHFLLASAIAKAEGRK